MVKDNGNKKRVGSTQDNKQDKLIDRVIKKAIAKGNKDLGGVSIRLPTRGDIHKTG